MHDMITTAEVSRRTGIPMSTVTWRARNGHIPAIKLPGRGQWLFHPDDIKDLAKEPTK